tara:strand:+ start:2258 stop:2539 length:282 start_codon:yes stop_codon:yes gene_type:complete
MITNDKIAFIAVMIGLMQLIILTKRIKNTDDISYYSLDYVILGIISSTLWIIYQYRKGSNFSVLYSSAGLLLSLYILLRLLKDKKDKKDKNKE